ncbi:uncharacterized protein V6R79_009905 [Siganus canaliculatus]
MELYLDLLSQPCRSVFMFAKAVGIPFEFKLVQLAAAEQMSEEFGKLSIVRKVPVMKDGNFVLTESVAILKYLVQKHSSKVADHWYPADLQQRARVNEYLAWQHSGLRTAGSKYFILMLMYKPVMGHEIPKEKLDAALQELNQSLDLLENKFLQDKPFIVGDKISVADLVALVEIMQPVGCGKDVFKERPKLGAWKDRVIKEFGQKLFDEAHDPIMKVSEVMQELEKTGVLEKMKPRYQKLFS